MIRDLFDVTRSLAGPLLTEAVPPWAVFDSLGGFILRIGEDLPGGFEEIAENIWAGSGAVIAASVRMTGPAIIGRNAEIRPGCVVRQNVLIGDGAVLGASVDIGNSVVFDEAELQGFNRIDDSVLGWKVVLGPGAALAARRLDGASVRVRLPEGGVADSGRACLGCFLGDGAVIGSNAVVNPGAVVGRNARVHPLASLRGYLPEGSVYRGGSAAD